MDGLFGWLLVSYDIYKQSPNPIKPDRPNHPKPLPKQDDFKADKAWLHLGALHEAMAACHHRLAEAQQPLFAQQPALAAAAEAK